MLKYLELQRPCDATFFLFLVSWPYTRHYIYNQFLYSSYFDAPVIFHRDNHHNPTYQSIPPKWGVTWAKGYYWNPSEGYYFTYEVHMAFIALLAVLQAILLLWFVMIVRLAARVIRGAHAEDDRSDDEQEDGEEEEEEEEGEGNGDVTSFSVANGNIPTTNGIANGIHHRKLAS
jgi:very-long-chain ceramide synthase